METIKILWIRIDVNEQQKKFEFENVWKKNLKKEICIQKK